MQKFLVCLLFLCCHKLPAQNIPIDISIPFSNESSTPLKIQLLKPLQTGKQYYLQNQKTKTKIPAQLLDSLTLVFMSEEKIDAGNYPYLILTENKASREAPVKIEKKENGLLVKVKNQPVFFYHTKEAMPPTDSPAYYKRSGFIHPLYSPSGKVLTDDFPVGHVHQHAIFTAWTSTLFKKSSVDFWNQQSNKGTVEHVQVLEIVEGPVFSQMKISLRHKSHEFGEVLQENWTLTIYPSTKHFLFDLESVQRNTSADTLFLNKYHYGGLAFRGNAEWNPDDPKKFKSPWKILTSEGMKDSAANASHARWVDASGNLDKATAGATVFNHPSNFRYPQAIRVHPTMPYWAFAPVVDGPFFIAPGSQYESKFRYYIYDGKATAETIEKNFKAWIEPVAVKLAQ